MNLALLQKYFVSQTTVDIMVWVASLDSTSDDFGKIIGYVNMKNVHEITFVYARKEKSGKHKPRERYIGIYAKPSKSLIFECILKIESKPDYNDDLKRWMENRLKLTKEIMGEIINVIETAEKNSSPAIISLMEKLEDCELCNRNT
jgi:hypothetical protein